MLEESVAQTSLALQNFRLVSACNNSNTVIGKLMEKRDFHEWSFSAAKVTWDTQELFPLQLTNKFHDEDFPMPDPEIPKMC